MVAALASPLLDIRRIYLEPAAEGFARGREVLAHFPDAERIPVESHWRIPDLREADPADFLRPKRETLVLGVKRGMGFRPNGRSADFIAPSTSNGCAMACAYCYVARRKGHANPISVFANIDEITAATIRHATRLGPKPRPNQVDPEAWVYDLGENGDLSVDADVSDNVRDLVASFRGLPNAKGSFATKWVNPALLGYDPQHRTRIRMSLMPHALARLLDIRAAPVATRIAAIPELHRAGYEVQLNFSPVVLREGWEADWGALFEELDDALPQSVKDQLAAEVILLTHNAELHEVNLAWHPKAEELLWRPDIQEEKRSESGAVNLRYRAGWKGRWLRRFLDLLTSRMPYCMVRYAF
ncbi:spore photoproduct lyase family protein [Falsiroseomonas sp. E2-1-a20]|uniref:spore photoproduct lyase family protein n=1 Tax=Falsiroseomonas sp. E2-1-a20 TaxID=3239300 RepID=UPI003F2FA682